MANAVNAVESGLDPGVVANGVSGVDEGVHSSLREIAPPSRRVGSHQSCKCDRRSEIRASVPHRFWVEGGALERRVPHGPRA